MLKEDQLWFSERYTKEDKIKVTWDRRWTDGKTDSRNLEEHVSYPNKLPFRSLLRVSDYHETLRWLLTSKRFLMVKIPIGNGSKQERYTDGGVHTSREKQGSKRAE